MIVQLLPSHSLPDEKAVAKASPVVLKRKRGRVLDSDDEDTPADHDVGVSSMDVANGSFEE